MAELCDYCEQPTSHVCSECRDAYYCSVDCQAADEHYACGKECELSSLSEAMEELHGHLDEETPSHLASQIGSVETMEHAQQLLSELISFRLQESFDEIGAGSAAARRANRKRRRLARQRRRAKRRLRREKRRR